MERDEYIWIPGQIGLHRVTKAAEKPPRKYVTDHIIETIRHELSLCDMEGGPRAPMFEVRSFFKHHTQCGEYVGVSKQGTRVKVEGVNRYGLRVYLLLEVGRQSDIRE